MTKRRTSAAIIAGAAVVTLLCSSPARAQTTCGGASGPDVIVGDITLGANNGTGSGNYTMQNGREALSLGTTSCNMGTVWLNWISSTNQHPVIGGALYRYKLVDGAGRFEQIGVSWLKHGFFALSQSLCCTCSGTTDGTHLGVGCSDPYTASRNGTQSGLGPRWQVNANTGFFNYPHAGSPSGGNLGRIEVELVDLELTGGGNTTRYFGEAQYVSPDDAAAGNQNNNASWREVSVTASTIAGSYVFTLTGTTQRQQDALRAWKVADPAVTLVDVDTPDSGPSPGRVILGYRTTNLGGGQYRYEYAVHNLNSDLSISSFSIPKGPTVNITNVGFHDVVYRGNEGMGGVPYEATDWSPVVAGPSVSWACTPFSVSNNANAIRWGTTYNFRFDADAAPVTGTISLGTYKNAGMVTTSGDVPGSPIPGTPFCYGDGSLATLCPCFNLGGPGNGCANSQNSAGANLASAGLVNPDTVVLTSTGELPTALTIFLQGDTQDTSGLIFGDGLRCVTGNLKRLYVKNAVGGAVSAPTGGDPSITTRSAALGDPLSPGMTRYYQNYYRDPDGTFCPSLTFNVTNGQIITW